MPLDAILFDLGGTLIEYAGPYHTWPDLETPGFTAAYRILTEHGVTLPEYDAFQAAGFAHLPGRWQRATTGERNLRLVDLLEEVLLEFGVNSFAPDWLEAAAEAYQDAVCAQAYVVPGAQETLAALKECNFKLGLLSNTMFTGVAHRSDLARFGLADFFDAMLFSADVNKWKPNPEPFLHLLEELQVEPSAAVYIGDDPAADVAGGQRAGMRTIHFQSSQRFPTPDGIIPDARIDKLPELLTLLQNWPDADMDNRCPDH